MINTTILVAVVCIGLIFMGFALTYREFREMSGRRYARAASPARAQAERVRGSR